MSTTNLFKIYSDQKKCGKHIIKEPLVIYLLVNPSSGAF